MTAFLSDCSKPSEEIIANEFASMDIPPAQDSPKNIVNILPDDCIQKILRKIDDVDDFMAAAQVCVRFQENAKICFPFKKIKLGYNQFSFYGKAGKESDKLLFHPVKSCLGLFGAHITSIEYVPPFLGQDCLDLISLHCGKSLIELEIKCHKYDVLHLQSPFPVLKKLKMEGGSFQSFDASFIFPELESLEFRKRVGTPTAEWLVTDFPKLQHVQFVDICTLTIDIFIEFQYRNPQLESLSLHGSNSLTRSVCQNMRKRMSNTVESQSSSAINSNIIDFSILQHLRKLDLFEIRIGRKLVNLIISSIIENAQQIEELKIGHVDSELGEMLQQIETIKVLHIEKISGDILVDIVKNLPNLEYLRVEGLINTTCLWTAKKILQHSTSLARLDILKNLRKDRTIDINEFDSISTLATGRFKVNIIYSKQYRNQLGKADSDMMDSAMNKENEWVRFVELHESN